MADAAENVAHRIDADFVVAAGLHLGLDAPDDGTLLCAERLDGDQIPEEADQIAFVEAGLFENTFKHDQ